MNKSWLILFSFYLSLIIFSNGYTYQHNLENFSWEEISKDYLVKNFTVKDGLPINSVNYMVHHSDGYIYIASNDGLVRFDGTRFVSFTTFNTNEMKSNRISWVASGKGSDLWFTDVNNRLYLLQNGDVKWIELNGNKVLKTEFLKNERVLINTDKGLLIQNEGSLEFEPFSNPITQQNLYNSFVFEGERVFFLKEEGLFLMKDQNIELILSKTESLLKPEAVFNMIITKDGTKWLLGRQSQLLKISITGKQTLYQFSNLEEIIFWDFIEKNTEELLISSKKGYILFNRSTGEFKETDQMSNSEGYFEDNAWMFYKEGELTKLNETIFIDGKPILKSPKGISFLMLDREGAIWVATNGAGIYQISRNKFITLGNNLYSGLENIYGFSEGKEGVWVTSFQSNIYSFNQNGITNWGPLNSELKYTFFRSIHEDNEGVVWAGNFNLWFLKEGVWKKDPLYIDDEGQINAIYKDSKNRLWIGTNQGLFLKTESKFSSFKDTEGKSLSSIVSIQELENGMLLFCTTGDGVAFLNGNNKFEILTEKEGLGSNLIRDVYISARDTLWIVTEDKGLNRVILKEDFEVQEVSEVTIKDGLIDNSLHRLLADEFGFFWINSNKGIMRIQKQNIDEYLDKKKKELQVEYFGEEDGLISIEGNGGAQEAGLITKDGKLLLPNQEGIVFTRPEWHSESSISRFVAPIFESVTYSDTTLSLLGRKRLMLPKGERSTQIKFTLPLFSTPEKLELEYTMDKVNNNWQKVGSERLAVFTNLPPGENILRVRGRLLGSKEYKETTILINTPSFFYETFWFIIAFAFLLFSTFILLVQFLLKQSKKREKKLNLLVNERTEALLIEKEKTEEAFVQIQKLSEAKSQFFTNFTHELRTPLSLILNPLDDMLQSGPKPINTEQDSLRLMRRNAIKLKELVNKLLDVSKLNSGELSLRFQKVSIKELTKQLSQHFEHEFTRKEIFFEVKDSFVNPELYLDVNAWEHICTNLLSNALKFTPKRGSIIIRIQEEEKEVEIHFIDSGSGIPQEEINYIFDPYFQGDSLISKAGGTGLGLALVKGLIEKMEGSISVSSSPKKKTDFLIKLKKGTNHIPEGRLISKASEEVNVEELFKEKEKNLSPILIDFDLEGSSKTKVLLVEDNSDFRDYLFSVISKEYTVKVATNGKEGLRALESFDPEIIVSDIMMPEMDGYEMMKTIRSMQAYKHIPFIFLSAKDSAADIEKGLNVGADIYLTKPVENSLLLTQLKVLLRREEELKQNFINIESPKLDPLVQQVNEVIQRHLGNPDLNVELIANALSMSSASLYRKWKLVSSETINKTITLLRFNEALKLIKEEKLTISEAAYVVGFKQLSYFSRAFKKVHGVSPQEYLVRRG